MNLIRINSIVPRRVLPRGIRHRLCHLRLAQDALKIPVVGLLTSVAVVGQAFAQAATPSTDGIGAQL